jgi:hypothetical protein
MDGEVKTIIPKKMKKTPNTATAIRLGPHVSFLSRWSRYAKIAMTSIAVPRRELHVPATILDHFIRIESSTCLSIK